LRSDQLCVTRLEMASSAHNDLNDALLNAIRASDISGVRLALENGASANYVDPYDESMLIWAAYKGNCDIIDALVQHGAHINFARRGGLTALFRAVDHGHGSAVKRLVRHGANPDLGNEDYTPLTFAIIYDDIDMVTTLIECGADAKRRAPRDDLPLEMAFKWSSQMTSIVAKAIRQQDAKSLLQWLLAMAPLQLPIYIYLDLANLSLDFQDVKTGVGVTKDGRVYSAVLTEVEKINMIQGVMDSYRRVLRQRSL